jgi:TPR repeat protein
MIRKQPADQGVSMKAVSVRSWPVIASVAVFLCLLCAVPPVLAQNTGAPQPAVLTNTDIEQMVATGLSADVIRAKIANSQCQFDTSTAALVKLKAAKVPDAIVVAMLSAASSTPAAEFAQGKAAYDRKDYVEAMQWYQKAAAQGNADAQIAIGHLYANGRGVTRDPGQAMQWYQKAAAQGNAEAQYHMGTFYELGLLGVTQDYGQAMQWFQKAAAQGHALALREIGQFYADGRGVTQDYGQAVQWYRKAAAQGDALALNQIGSCYEAGLGGVTQDYGQAMQWYLKAAAHGDLMAPGSIGRLYENGQGVTQDYCQAMQWYRKAAAQGDDYAQQRIAQLQGRCAAQP